MKRLIGLLALVCVALSITACNQPLPQKEQTFAVPMTTAPPPYQIHVIDGVSWSVPDWINIQTWPPLGGKVSPRDAKLLRLHLEPLDEGGWYVNELRERHTFETIYLPKGTMVWATHDGSARYKADCGNRIELALPFQTCPAMVACPSGTFSPKADGSVNSEPAKSTGTMNSEVPWWAGIVDFFWTIAKGLIYLLFLMFIGVLLVEAFQGIRNWLRNRQTLPPAPIAPQPIEPVVIPTPIAVTPVQKAGTVVKTRTSRFGPYQSVVVSDRQEDGYHATGDGVEIGVFKTPGRTIDDGANGHFFEVTENI